MKKTGEMLQNLRIQRGATLAELSSALKINSKVLHALETGNADQLPKPPFVRGFIKSYVMHFKADPEPYLREYHKEMGLSVVVVPEEEPSVVTSATTSMEPVTPQPQKIVEKAPPETKKTSVEKSLESTALEIKKEPSKSEKSSSASTENKDFSYSDFDAEEKQRDGWRVLIFSLVVVILTLVIYVAYRTIDRYQREARISEETERSLGEMAANAVQVPPAEMPIPESALPAVVGDPSDAAQAEPQSTDSLVTAPTDTSSTDTTSKPQVSPSNATEAATPPPSAGSAANTSATTTAATVASDARPMEATAQANSGNPRPSQEGSAPTPTSSDSSTATTPEPAKPPQRVREVVVEALEDIVVDYDAGGKKGTLRLKKDQVHVLRFSKSATLKINDAGSVNLSVDGTDRGVPGEKGNPVVVRY